MPKLDYDGDELYTYATRREQSYKYIYIYVVFEQMYTYATLYYITLHCIHS